MAHNIMQNKRMFYVGEQPWHGLGTKLDEPATAVEAIEAAGLDYKVEKRNLYYLQNGAPSEIRGKFATVNSETGKYLGVVSDAYNVIQNVEAFSFFDVLVGEGQAIYHTAGALGNGERIWILAKLPKNMTIAREDIVEKYLVLTNSHDATSSLKMYFTPVRVVCQNTLIVSLKDSASGISIRHVANAKSKFDEARTALGIASDYYAQFETIAKQLVDVKLNVSETNQYFDTLLGIDDMKADEISGVVRNQKDDLLALFENGTGNSNADVRHSTWAAYNAVTEYTDHYKHYVNEKNDPSTRLKSIWFGSAARLKSEAFDLACEFANVKVQ